MNSKKFRSKTILTVVTAPLVGTVMSSSFVASADWSFSLGKDDTKGVYYIGSGSTREEYANMWEFIRALISKIFSFSRSEENVKDMSNSVDDKSVKLEQQQQDAVSRYETIAEILKKMRNDEILDRKRLLDDGSYHYGCLTGDIKKNSTKSDGTFTVADIKINKEQMIVDYNVSGLNKKFFINFEEENSLEKAIDVLENIKIHHNIVRNQIQEKLFNEEKKKKNNLIFTFDEKEGIKISPKGGKAIELKGGDYIEKIVLSNDYCSVTLQYANKEIKKYNLTDLNAACELNGILEKIKVEDDKGKIENYNVCAKVKEQIIKLDRECAFDEFNHPLWDEMHRLGAKEFSIEQRENFIRESGKILTFKFCTKDLFKSYIEQGVVYFYLADVTIAQDKLVVDYRPSGLDKVVVVNFNDKDALEKATTALEKVRAHSKVFSYLNERLYHNGLVRYYKKGEEKKVKFSADVGKTWEIIDGKGTVKDATMDNYSKFTLNYTNGETVSYDLTESKDANELMKILENSYFESEKKQENYDFSDPDDTVLE